MTPIKDFLWLAETSFRLLWQILMSNSDKLNFAQDMSTSGFVSAARQLNIDWIKLSPWRVVITFFTAVWQLKIDFGKLIQDIAWFLMSNVLNSEFFHFMKTVI